MSLTPKTIPRESHAPSLRESVGRPFDVARTWFLILAFAALGFLYTSTAIFRRSDALEINSAQLELGTIAAKDHFETTLDIYNSTSRDVRVNGFSWSCRCATASPTHFTIPSRATQRVTVTIDLRIANVSTSETKHRPLRLSFAPHADVGPGRYWTLTGHIVDLPISAPLRLAFPSPCIRGTEFPIRTITIRTFEAIERMEATSGSEALSVSCQRNTDNPDKFTVQVAPTERLDDGEFSVPIYLHCQQDGRELSPWKIIVQGTVFGALRPESTHVNFGVVPCESTRVVPVTILLPHASAFSNVEVAFLERRDEQTAAVRAIDGRSIVNGQSAVGENDNRRDERARAEPFEVMKVEQNQERLKIALSYSPRQPESLSGRLRFTLEDLSRAVHVVETLVAAEAIPNSFGAPEP
jgi:hypothetical protein